MQSSCMSKTYLKSDHFKGWISPLKRNAPLRRGISVEMGWYPRRLSAVMDTLGRITFHIAIALIAVAAAGFVMWLLEQQGWIP